VTKIADTLVAAATKSGRLRRQNLITEMEAAYNCRSTPPPPPTTARHQHRRCGVFRRTRFRSRACETRERTCSARIQWKTPREEMRYDNGHVDQPPNADYTLFLRILKLSTVTRMETRRGWIEIEREGEIKLSHQATARYPI